MNNLHIGGKKDEYSEFSFHTISVRNRLPKLTELIPTCSVTLKRST